MKFVNDTWTVVGTAGFSAGGEIFDISLALDKDGVPYVAYRDIGNYSYKATVMKFVNDTWTVVGTAGFSADSAWGASLALDKEGVPYVAYTDGDNGPATVMKYDIVK